LDEAAEAPLLFEKGGLFYRLEACASADEWAGYDPHKVIAALDATAGTLSAAEADALMPSCTVPAKKARDRLTDPNALSQG
jgi:hypothetical protein